MGRPPDVVSSTLPYVRRVMSAATVPEGGASRTKEEDMTIAIHRRQQRTMLGLGLVTVLVFATVLALHYGARPITVTDPGPVVTQPAESQGLQPTQNTNAARSLRDAEIHGRWLESMPKVTAPAESQGLAAMRDAEVHALALDSTPTVASGAVAEEVSFGSLIAR
jgi:hypothetical protein